MVALLQILTENITRLSVIEIWFQKNGTSIPKDTPWNWYRKKLPVILGTASVTFGLVLCHNDFQTEFTSTGNSSKASCLQVTYRIQWDSTFGQIKTFLLTLILFYLNFFWNINILWKILCLLDVHETHFPTTENDFSEMSIKIYSVNCSCISNFYSIILFKQSFSTKIQRQQNENWYSCYSVY